MKFLAVGAAVSWLLAADGTDSALDFGVYGVAGTTVAILLWGIKVLWVDNGELRREKNELASKSLEKITEVATAASHQLAESTKSMEAATVMMHQLAGRPSIGPEQHFELIVLLRELRARREQG